MFRSPSRLTALLIVSLLIVACSASVPGTLDGIWNEYVDAFRQYQQELYEFGADKWPEYESVLRTQRKYQLARVNLRDRQFQFLMERNPDELPTGRTVHDLIHFEWPDQYDTALTNRSPETAELMERVKRLKKQSKRNDAWPEIRSRFRSLPSDSEYSAIKQRYQDRLKQLGEAFRQRRDD